VTPHEHFWSLTTVRVVRGDIDDDDPLQHTTFTLLFCVNCPTVTVFPRENFALTTPRYRAELRAWLAREGLTLDPEAT